MNSNPATNLINDKKSYKDYLTVSEAAQQLNISASTLRRLEAEGKIRSFRLSNGYRVFRYEDLLNLKVTYQEENITDNLEIKGNKIQIKNPNTKTALSKILNNNYPAPSKSQALVFVGALLLGIIFPILLNGEKPDATGKDAEKVHNEEQVLAEQTSVSPTSSTTESTTSANTNSTVINESQKQEIQNIVIDQLRATVYPVSGNNKSVGTDENRFRSIFAKKFTLDKYGNLFLEGKLDLQNSARIDDSLKIEDDLKVDGDATLGNTTHNTLTINKVTYVYPGVQGAASQVLVNDGNGNLTWEDQSGSGGGSGSWSDLTNPTDNLTLDMSSFTTDFNWGSSTGSSNLFTFRDSDSNTGTGYLMNIETASGSSLNPLHITSGGAEALMVGSNGRVGIGTTQPHTKLDILNEEGANSAGQESLRIQANHDAGTVGSGGLITFYDPSDTQAAYLQSYTFGPGETGLAFGTGFGGATTKMVIDNSGRVGIGTVTPQFQFHNQYLDTVDDHPGEFFRAGISDYFINADNTADIKVAFQGRGRNNTDNGGTLVGLYGTSFNNLSGGNMSLAIGAFGDAGHNPGITGTIDLARGLYGRINNEGTGTITDAQAGFFEINNVDGGILGTIAGVEIATPGLNSSSATTNYGLHIGDQDCVTSGGCTSAWAIFSEGGTSYFAGSIGIGTTTPAYKLDVIGQARVWDLKSDTLTLREGNTLNGVSGFNPSINSNGGLGTGTTLRIDPTGNLKNIASIQGGQLYVSNGGTYGGNVQYSTDTDPLFAIFTDLNADGWQDIISANTGADDISVFLNNQDGTFGGATHTTVGSLPVGAAAADLNGDGFQDIAVANNGPTAESVSVLLGNGLGGFTNNNEYSTGDGSGPRSVALTDINNDGKKDILTASIANDTLIVLYNNGDGTFPVSAFYSTGVSPRYVATADFNADGWQDAVVANGDDDNVSVFINNKDGTFAARVNYGVGDLPRFVATGDLNGDLAPDIAATNYDNNSVSVLLNNGDGTFGANTDTGIQSNPLRLVIGDVNGDGINDIVAPNENEDSVSVLTNDGTSTFSVANYATDDSPRSADLGDVNNDGKLDIVTANLNPATVSVLLNTVNPVLFAQASTGRVGIGTTSPNTKLEVVGSDATPQFRIGVDDTPASFTTMQMTDFGELQVDMSGDFPMFRVMDDAQVDGDFIENGSSILGDDNTADSVNFNVLGFQGSSGTTTGDAFKFISSTLTSGTLLLAQSTTTTLTGNLQEIDLDANNAGNTGTMLKLTNTGTLNGVTGIMVTNLGTGPSFVINDETGDADATPLLVNAAGLVGIGTSAPGFRLSVEENAATVAQFNRTGDDGTIISLAQDGTEEGTISVSGNTISYNAFTGSHYAWIDSTNKNITKGELVSFTGNNKYFHNNPNSEIIYGAKKTPIANDSKVLGAFLSRQEPNKPETTENPNLIMAVGNGVMWVVQGENDNARNLDNGDYLISSNVAGHAMLDPETYDTSYIIARLAEPIDWNKVTTTIKDSKGNARKHKLASVLFESFKRSRLFTGNIDASGNFSTYSKEEIDNKLADVDKTIGLDTKVAAQEIQSNNAQDLKTKINTLENKIASISRIRQSTVSANTTLTRVAQMNKEIDTLKSRLDLLTGNALASIETTESANLSLLPSSELESLQINKTLNNLGDLTVNGKSYLSETAITGKLSVGFITIDDTDTSINSLTEPLKIQNNSLADVDFFNGAIILSRNGSMKITETIEAKKVIAEEYAVKAASQSIGSTALEAGNTTLVINTPYIKNNSKIFLTPTSTTNGQSLTVGAKMDGQSFEVKIDKASQKNINFDWMIVNIE